MPTETTPASGTGIYIRKIATNIYPKIKAFILMLNFFKIIFHIVASDCAIYDGVPHPDDNNVCCGMACGSFCGQWNCDKGPGGSSACCGGSITSSGKKCSSSVAAPCEIGDMFYIQL